MTSNRGGGGVRIEKERKKKKKNARHVYEANCHVKSKRVDYLSFLFFSLFFFYDAPSEKVKFQTC